jgi:hypothetical protein
MSLKCIIYGILIGISWWLQVITSFNQNINTYHLSRYFSIAIPALTSGSNGVFINMGKRIQLFKNTLVMKHKSIVEIKDDQHLNIVGEYLC